MQVINFVIFITDYTDYVSVSGIFRLHRLKIYLCNLGCFLLDAKNLCNHFYEHNGLYKQLTQPFHVFGKIGFEFQKSLCYRVRKSQCCGMQRMAADLILPAASVLNISQ